MPGTWPAAEDRSALDDMLCIAAAKSKSKGKGKDKGKGRDFLRALIDRRPLPSVKIDIPVVDKRETFDIEKWALTNDANYIALSFVQCPEDVIECRTNYDGKPIKIVSKIENVEGFKNFDAILKESDGISITHGDLGMEIQDEVLQKTKAAGKLAICATKTAPSSSSLTLAMVC